MLHLLLTVGPAWLYHPLGQCAGNVHEVLRCKSYNFWSGSASDISEVTIIVGGATAYVQWRRRTRCHVEAPVNCRRFGHPVAGTGHRACRRHHPHAEEKGSGITVEDIARHHEDSGA